MIKTFEENYGVAGVPCLGHDRDEPARHASARSSPNTPSCRRGPPRHQAEAGALAVRRRDEDHRRRRQASCRGTARPSAGSRCAGPPWPRPISREDSGILDDEGFFDTGDVATIDRYGYMQITDRSKDVIKSGGEWISSIDLENLAVGHPKVAEAAVIGVRHPKWDERPLLDHRAQEGRDGHQATRSSPSCEGKIAKWWMPDDVVFVERHTAYRDRQDPEDGAARPVQGLRAADRCRGRVMT